MNSKNAECRLHAERPAGAEIVRVVQALIAAALTEVTATDVAGAERAHRARVGCKKIRATLRLVAPQCPKACACEDEFFRDSARKLAALRETNVVLDTLDALRQQWGDKADRRAFTEVRRVLLAGRQTTALDATTANRRLAQFEKRMRKVGARLAGWEITGDGFDVLAEGCEEAYRKARRAFRRARASPSVATFHTWRKRAKAHACHCELFRDAWPDVMKKWTRSLKLLTRLLGDEHDLAILRENILTHVEAADKNESSRGLLELIETRRAELRGEAMTLGRRLFAEKPPAMVRRVAIWWLTARDHGKADDHLRGERKR